MVIKKADTDIDIDFQYPKKALESLDYVRAILIDDDGMTSPHKSGVYFQDIPYDPTTRLSTIPSKEAEERGYFKLDFLHVHKYDGIQNEEHLDRLMNKEPMWEMLEDEFFVKQLTQIHDHFELVSTYAPKSIEQLAMVLAMIRPSKKYLIGNDWNEIEKSIWDKPINGDYYFKKSHSVAYSLSIVVQMNLIIEKLLEEPK